MTKVERELIELFKKSWDIVGDFEWYLRETIYIPYSLLEKIAPYYCTKQQRIVCKEVVRKCPAAKNEITCSYCKFAKRVGVKKIFTSFKPFYDSLYLEKKYDLTKKENKKFVCEKFKRILKSPKDLEIRFTIMGCGYFANIKTIFPNEIIFSFKFTVPEWHNRTEKKVLERRKGIWYLIKDEYSEDREEERINSIYTYAKVLR